jgi:hypothetical protein
MPLARSCGHHQSINRVPVTVAGTAFIKPVNTLEIVESRRRRDQKGPSCSVQEAPHQVFAVLVVCGRVTADHPFCNHRLHDCPRGKPRLISGKDAALLPRIRAVRTVLAVSSICAHPAVVATWMADALDGAMPDVAGPDDFAALAVVRVPDASK